MLEEFFYKNFFIKFDQVGRIFFTKTFSSCWKNFFYKNFFIMLEECWENFFIMMGFYTIFFYHDGILYNFFLS
jgi:hypothetical protein